MKAFSLLKSIPFSFFSVDLYKDVARRWHGLGFVYALVLLLTAVLVAHIMLAVKLGQVDVEQNIMNIYKDKIEANEDVPSLEAMVNSGLDMLSQAPPITFQGGVASSQVDQPYVIIEPITQEPVIIVDTTGEVTGLQGSGALMLITDRAVVTRKKENREQVDYFSSVDTDAQYVMTIASHGAAQIPRITLKGGRAQTEEARPYHITNLYDGETIAVIDTTGQITSLETSGAPVLLTGTHFYMESTDEGGNPKNLAFLLSDINEENLLLLLREWVPTAQKWLIGALLISAPFIALFKFVIVILGLLLMGGLGRIIAAIMGVKGLPYEVAVRLSAVSLTPAVIAYTIFGLSFFLSLVLAVAYLIFAIAANRHVPNQPSSPTIGVR